MQTIDRVDEFHELNLPDPPRRRPIARAMVATVVVVGCAAGAYAVGSSRSHTTTHTVIRTVRVTPTTAKPLDCVPGVAPGSCNHDEFAEAQLKDQPLDAATRAAVARQLTAARAAALRYPTVAAAQRAGMIEAGGFSPLTGAHYINVAGSIGPFNPSQPGAFIYDGTSAASKIIGLMYLSSDATAPQGFAGPNDHWHQHWNTCIGSANGKIVVPFAVDSSVTKSQCDAVGGTFMARTTWMVHAWVVPGWDSPSGVFSHDNRDVLCADGTTKTDATGFCAGT